jgi:hypothetical protein
MVKEFHLRLRSPRAAYSSLGWVYVIRTILVSPAGFEPAIFAMKTRCVRPTTPWGHLKLVALTGFEPAYSPARGLSGNALPCHGIRCPTWLPIRAWPGYTKPMLSSPKETPPTHGWNAGRPWSGLLAIEGETALQSFLAAWNPQVVLQAFARREG